MTAYIVPAVEHIYATFYGNIGVERTFERVKDVYHHYVHAPIFPEPSLQRGEFAVRDHLISMEEASRNEYDFIVIGGGAAGCSLSRTLSDDYRVLLIERGPSRSEPEAFESRSIERAGVVIANPTVSQPVVTSEGVMSHIANVLGGGTSINMGISIKETREYFDYMAKEYDFHIDYDEMEDAIDWVRSRVVHPMPQDTAYSHALEAFADDFYGDHNRGAQSRLMLDSSWNGETFFDPNKNFARLAADVLLLDADPRNLHVLTKANVTKISFDDERRARCVTVQDVTDRHPNSIVSTPATFFEPFLVEYSRSPLGTLLRNVSGIKRKVTDAIRSFGRSSGLLDPEILDTPQEFEFCPRPPNQDDPGGNIILSSGTLLSPVILANSGIGTSEALAATGATPIVRNETIGKNMTDRALIPVGIFMKDDEDYDDVNDWSVPRVVESIAIGVGGDDPDYCRAKAWEDSFSSIFMDGHATCNLQNLENLGGARIAEGVIYATYYFVPPAFRQHPLIKEFIGILRDCEYGMAPLGFPFTKKIICPHLRSTLDCLQRIRAAFYFQSQPLSKFQLSILEPPEELKKIDSGFGQGVDKLVLKIDGEYLSTPAEQLAAVQGIKRIVEGINDGYFDDVGEEMSPQSCPRTVVLGVIGAMARVYESLALSLALIKVKQNGIMDKTNSLPSIAISRSRQDHFELLRELERLENSIAAWEPHLGLAFSDDVSRIQTKLTEASLLNDVPRDAHGNSTFEVEKVTYLPSSVHTELKSISSDTKGIPAATSILEAILDTGIEEKVFAGEFIPSAPEISDFINIPLDTLLDASRRLSTSSDEVVDTDSDPDPDPSRNSDAYDLLKTAVDIFDRRYRRNSTESAESVYASSVEIDGNSRRLGSVNKPDNHDDLSIQDDLSTKDTAIIDQWLEYWDLGKAMTTKSEDGDADVKGSEFIGPSTSKRKPRVATFPPNLPDPESDRQLLDYAQTYKTSIWHWIGSVKASHSPSDPVTNDFKVRGVDNLYVVDASVLPAMPRMNPVITLIGLGRYAALKIT